MYEMMLNTMGDQSTPASHGGNFGRNLAQIETHILDVEPGDYFQIQGLINNGVMLDIQANRTWAMMEIIG